MRRGPRKARVAHDDGRVVLLLGPKQVQERNRVRLGRVAADDKDRAAVVDVVVAVGHGAVAPCVRHTRNGGRVTDPRLVIHVVRAPVGRKLAEQVGLFVVVLGRSQPVHAVRAAFVPDVHHAAADLVDGLLPRDPDPLAVLFLHGVLQAAFAMCVLAHRSALGTMCAKVERAVPARLLARPDTVLYLGHDRAADRTVRAHRLLQFHLARRSCLRRSLGDGPARGGNGRQAPDHQSRSAQKRAPVYRSIRGFGQDTCPLGASRNPVGLFPKHVASPLLAAPLPGSLAWLLLWLSAVGRHATSR